MTNLPPRPIHTPEEIYQFISDANNQRQQEIYIEDMIDQISRS